MIRRGIPTAILGLLFVGASADCTLIASSELKTGIGQPCAGDDECQGGVCSAGVCSTDCTVHEDCPAPSICIQELCKIGCQVDTECTTQGTICEGFACVAGCRDDQGCPSGKVCTNLACVDGCRGDTECPTGNICNQGSRKCEPGCRKEDSECGGQAAGKICEAEKCQNGCRTDEWCTVAGTICEALTCVTGCRTDEVCGKGNICVDKACKPGCKDSAGCPDGNYCDTTTVATGECKTQLAVAAILPDDSSTPAEDGMTASHKIGLDDATTAAYVNFGADRYRVVDKKRTAADVAAAIDKQVAEGAKVIITTTNVANAEARKAAAKYPATKFVTTGSRSNEALPNVGAYWGVNDQLWYAAGLFAAREAYVGTRCIGMILPTPTKQIVRETNAFTRGVLKFNNGIKVVVRWVGATQDVPSGGAPSYSYKANTYEFDSANDGKLYREELLAAQLADLGCTLIAHRTETQRVVSFVERIAPRVNASKIDSNNRDLFSMGVDAKDACREDVKSTGNWIQSCLGSPYWNWGPLYQNLFSKMYQGTWSGEQSNLNFQTGANALMKFELSQLSSKTGIPASDGPIVMSQVANATWDAVFQGPYDFNGQRDLDGDGIPELDEQSVYTGTLAEDELQRTCWFVKGVYELNDYTQVNLANLIPAMVPYGPVVQNQMTVVDMGSTASKTKYGDVGSYITTQLSGSPANVMNCSTN